MATGGASESEPLTIPHGTNGESYQKRKSDSFETSMDLPKVRNCSSLLLATGWVAFAAILFVHFAISRPSTHGHPPSVVSAICSQNPSVDPIHALKPTSVLEGLKNGAVASDHPVCSEVGLQILKTKGGNAVDAAVAVSLCLGVANPASSGLGGGAFMLIHTDKTTPVDDANIDFIDARVPNTTADAISGKITEVIDCREVAPAAASTLMYENLPKTSSLYGGLAIGVPGELKCLELAHARHGRLAWADVVEPAYQMAAKGEPAINENLAHEITEILKILEEAHLKDADWGLRNLLTHDDNWENIKLEGEHLFNPALASTLKAVRDEGAHAVYTGERASLLANDIQAAGGIVTAEDLKSYRATIRSPVLAHDVQGFSIVGVPPPSSGGAAIVGAMRFLATFLTPFASFPETLSVHRVIEASRHVFAIRMSLSDPNFGGATNEDAVRDLVEGSYMAALALATLDNGTLPLSQYGGKKWAQLKDTDGNGAVADANEGDRRKLARRFGYLEDSGTSHFSIVDADGNAVSMTSSVNTYFGSTVVSKSTGILLSNTMDDFGTPGRPNAFGLRPSEANFIVPGKKPLSSMSPTMLFRRQPGDNRLGDLTFVIGGSGGPKIISAIIQVMCRVILQGLPLFDAIVHPRIHDQLLYHGAAVTTAEKAVLEQGPSITLSQRTRDALISRGHRLVDVDYEGTVQAIFIDLETKQLDAACDVRKGGSPAGY